MNTALWIVQGLLGFMFTYAGILKATSPIDKLAVKMPWANDFSVPMVRFIGLSQFLIAQGMVWPWLLGIAPILTPIAASGLVLVMVFAMIYHIGKKEYKALPVNLVIAALAAFVAIGRF